MSYKVEVIADASGRWTSNGLRFLTQPEAEGYGVDLSRRWTLVEEFRVVESTETANVEWTGNSIRWF